MKLSFLALLSLFAGSQLGLAAAISIDTWYGFEWSPVAGSASFSFVTPVLDPGDPPWTIPTAATAYLVIVDGFASGDRFEAFNDGVSLGLTSVPKSGGATCAGGGTDPFNCLGDNLYSRGVFVLAPGSHSITIGVTQDPFNGGNAYFAVLSRVPTVVPEPATYGLIGVGLALAAVWRIRQHRRRIHGLSKP